MKTLSLKIFLGLFVVSLLPTSLLAQTNATQPDFDAAVKQFEFRFSGDARFRKDEETIVATTNKALREIYRICGITMPPKKKVVVQFGGIPSERNVIHYAITYPESFGSMMDFDAARCRQRGEDPYKVYQHELVHAVQQCILGQGVYAKFPRWLHEGVATFVGGHGEKRVNKFRGMGANIFNGLGSNVPSPAEYAEAYLAIVYLERTFGANALRSLVQEITNKPTPWKDAVKKATNLEWAQFEKSAKIFAVNYVAQLNNPNLAAQNNPPPRPQPPQQQNPPVVAPLQNAGKPVLGIFVNDLDDDTLRQLPTGSGLIITAVKDGTPAADIGLVAGDILMTIDGRSMRTVEDFLGFIRTKKPGDKVTLQIFHSGKTDSLKVQIGSAP